jgi:ubiquinone/menaquinone biosynthesis C-methylase UbiE
MTLKLNSWGLRHLYHDWAGAYDAIATVVSLGRWYDWVRLVQPFILGPRVLELGPGTGHLLEIMQAADGIHPVGLDESPRMLSLARARTRGGTPLVRAVGQNLPVASATLDTVVSTFPADFIRDGRVIGELYRALRPGGRLVIVPIAQIVGGRPLERFMAWSLATLGEAPRDSRRVVAETFLPPLEQAGFRVEVVELHLPGSLVIIILASKALPPF